eukprot:TRINITY_DN1658_c0_g1_i2.p1 TRINITY_DN1658_c0_g1~~TRINITY_DN1658_c0_g1_i2.p1  ORF type:complete len:269 (-),score=40.80 TRINITY_DN1658_c0_g1_i2:248-1054(-)
MMAGASALSTPTNSDYAALGEPSSKDEVGTRHRSVAKLLALAIGFAALASVAIIGSKPRKSAHLHSGVFLEAATSESSLDSGEQPVDPAFCKMCKDPGSGFDPKSAVCLEKCAPREKKVDSSEQVVQVVDPEICNFCKDPKSGLDPNSAMCRAKCAPRTASSASTSTDDGSLVVYFIAGTVYLIIGVFVAAFKGPDAKLPNGCLNDAERSNYQSSNDGCSQFCLALDCLSQCVMCCGTCTTAEIIRARCIFVFCLLFWPVACFLPSCK